MASRAEPIRSLSPAQQERFAQEKLRNIYLETCVGLSPHKDFLFLLQDIILWRKIAISAAIYCLVEMFFWHLYTSNNTYITVISDAVFWILLADGFWVVATRDRRDMPPRTGKGGDQAKRSFMDRMRKKQKQLQFMSLEDAIIRDAKSLEIGESAPYEVMCLWIAKVVMLIDNIQLALRHWSQEQPYLFAVVTGTFGLVCIIVGYLMSGTLLLFLLTNYLMFLPVFTYYNLHEKTQVFVNTHYPVLATKLSDNYKHIKSLLSPLAEQEFVGIQLDPNEPMRDDLPEVRQDQSDGSGDIQEGSEAIGTSESEPRRIPPIRDRSATLSLTPFDQNPLDSIAPFVPPSEGFPSITAFFNEDSISLPSFHQSYDQQQRQRGMANSKNRPHQRSMQVQDSFSLEPFEMIDPMDSFDEDDLSSLKPTHNDPSTVVPSAPMEPLPPYYSEVPSYDSPLLTGIKAPPKNSSTPYQQTIKEEGPVGNLRKRGSN